MSASFLETGATAARHYACTSEQLEARLYDELFEARYQQYGAPNGYLRQEFASMGFGETVGNKVLRDLRVRIVINKRKYEYRVDPEDAEWFKHLCEDVAKSQKRPELWLGIRVLTPDGRALTGVSEDLDALAAVPEYQLRIEFDPNAPVSSSAPPPRPTYAVPYSSSRIERTRVSQPAVEDLDAAALSTHVGAEARTAFDEGRMTPHEAEMLIGELVARLSQNIAQELPRALEGSAAGHDYASVYSATVRLMSSDKAFGGDRATYWKSARVQDVAQATAAISHKIAARTCATLASQANIGAGRGTTSRALGESSVWDDVRAFFRRSMRRRSHRSVAPIPSEHARLILSDVNKSKQPLAAPFPYMASSIGADASDALALRAAHADLACPYGGVASIACHHHGGKKHHGKKHGKKHHHHHGASSDDEPTNHSLACAFRKRHYGHRRGHKRIDAPIQAAAAAAPPPVTPLVPLAKAAAAPLIMKAPAAAAASAAVPKLVPVEREALVPLSTPVAAAVAKKAPEPANVVLKIDCGRCEDAEKKKKVMPIDAPYSLEGLEKIDCLHCTGAAAAAAPIQAKVAASPAAVPVATKIEPVVPAAAPVAAVAAAAAGSVPRVSGSADSFIESFLQTPPPRVPKTPVAAPAAAASAKPDSYLESFLRTPPPARVEAPLVAPVAAAAAAQPTAKPTTPAPIKPVPKIIEGPAAVAAAEAPVAMAPAAAVAAATAVPVAEPIAAAAAPAAPAVEPVAAPVAAAAAAVPVAAPVAEPLALPLHVRFYDATVKGGVRDPKPEDRAVRLVSASCGSAADIEPATGLTTLKLTTLPSALRLEAADKRALATVELAAPKAGEKRSVYLAPGLAAPYATLRDERTEMPAQGRAHVRLVNLVPGDASRVSVKLERHLGKEVFLQPTSAIESEAAKGRDTAFELVEAGRYRVNVTVDGGRKLTQELNISQRANHTLLVGCGHYDQQQPQSEALFLQHVASDRFDVEKLALASRFLERSDVRAGLEHAHSAGVLFAPSDDQGMAAATDGTFDDYFVAGEDPASMLQQRNSGDEPTLIALSGRTYVRNEAGTKLWSASRGNYVPILGTAHLPGRRVLVVIFEGTSQDAANLDD